GDPVLLVNVDGDYRYLGRLRVGFDAAGVIIPATLNADVNGAYATHAEAIPAVDAQPSERITAIVDGLREVLQRREGNILGFSEVYLDGRRSQVRTEATNLGNLTSDANLWYAKQYDEDAVISLKNGGGIRSAIGDMSVPAGSVDYTPEFGPPPAIPAVGKPEGAISQFDIEGSLRFNNSLSLLTVTATELRDILEHGVSATEEGATPGQFPQVAGMRFSFDPSRSNDRVRDVVIVNESGDVIDEVMTGGEIQGDANRTFRLVTLGFLAGGGDGYPFDALSSPNRVDLDAVELNDDPGTADFAPLGTEQDALAEYLLVRHGSADEAFEVEETSIDADLRIQNLSVRSSSLR
ncbi:MAG TPA: 5'-nucleotidase C-terminal domain-containing protein, partial [Alkalispirochaeta sp.]|nr:5'-nucleotidase C-terminal domain-containing protein [Alkalispirochaeta sp.]